MNAFLILCCYSVIIAAVEAEQQPSLFRKIRLRFSQLDLPVHQFR
jgi:hypothetical protein